MKLLLTDDNYLIYKFSDQGQPLKWIDLDRFKEAMETIGFGLILVFVVLVMTGVINIWEFLAGVN